MQHLKFDSIGEADLARLVADDIKKTRTLEYKQALELVSEEQKRELLSDITALANTDGGDLIIGVTTDKGVVVDLVGLRGFVRDDVLAKIENLLRDFVQPRLAGVLYHVQPLANGNHVLLIRVPHSFASPHMVRHKGVTRFCGRNAYGKYDLDVHELRSAFLASETLSERLKTFRLERVNRLLSGNAPLPLAGEHLLVLHILPVVEARADTRIATSEFQRCLHDTHLRPIASRGWTPGFTFDGLLVAEHDATQKSPSYVQIMRNGFLEAVNAWLLEPRAIELRDGPKVSTIPSMAWEKALIEAFPGYLQALENLSLPPPHVVSLSLLNVRNYVMWIDGNYIKVNRRSIDRDHLFCDELLLESAQSDPDRALRPLFDQVWNTCG